MWAARAPLADVRVEFAALTGPSATIPAAAVRCFNQAGVDWQGRDFTATIDVPLGRIQPVWCGIQVPLDARPGVYAGRLVVTAKGLPSVPVAVTLTVAPDTIRNARRG